MISYNKVRMRLNDDWSIVYDEDHTRTGYLQTKLKLPSGMTAEFGCVFYTGNTVTISFTVYRKRKKGWPDNPNETTGRDGLLPAMWALDCLRQVELALEDCKECSMVTISWENSRLRDIYGKVLGKRGYFFQKFDNGIYLIKKINDEGQN